MTAIATKLKVGIAASGVAVAASLLPVLAAAPAQAQGSPDLLGNFGIFDLPTFNLPSLTSFSGPSFNTTIFNTPTQIIIVNNFNFQFSVFGNNFNSSVINIGPLYNV